MICHDLPLFVYFTNAMATLLITVVGTGSYIASLASVHGIAQAVTFATRAVSRALHIYGEEKEKIENQFRSFLSTYIGYASL